MRKFLSIISINLLSFIALFLLCVSIICKAIAKLFERSLVLIGMVIVLLGIVMIRSLIIHPFTSFWGWVLGIAAIFIGGIIIVFLGSIIAMIIVSVAGFVIIALDEISDAALSGYASIYNKCELKYRKLGNSVKSSILCLFWTLFKGINIVLIKGLKTTLVLGWISAIAVIGGTFYWFNQQLMMTFGLNIIEYIELFRGIEIVFACIEVVLILAVVCICLISIGQELHTLGLILEAATSDYEDYMDMINDSMETITDHEFSKESIVNESDEAENKKINDKIEIFQNMIKDITEFEEKVEIALGISDDASLRASNIEYVNLLNKVMMDINSYEGKMTANDFNSKIKDQISHLERLNGSIMHQADKIIADSVKKQSKKAEKDFFEGCDTLEEARRRYKSHSKVYHPDKEGGDHETFVTMKNQYDDLIERLKSEL